MAGKRKPYDYAKELSKDTIEATLKQLLFKSMEVEPLREYMMLTIPSGIDELEFSDASVSAYVPTKYNCLNTSDGAHGWSISGEHPVHKTEVSLELSRDVEYLAGNNGGDYNFLERFTYHINITSVELSELHVRYYFYFNQMELIKPKRGDKFIESLYDAFKVAHTKQTVLDEYKEEYLDIKNSLAKIYSTCKKYV